MKGLGIIAVVAGHTFSGTVKDFIFLFHMPLFFFIGGYLFKVKPNFKQYLNDKTIHLIVPYICFLIIIYFPFHFLSIGALNSKNIMLYFIRPLVGGKYLFSYSSVFWFTTCFFFVQQFFNYIINKFQTNTLQIIILTMLLLSYLNSLFFPNFFLPWNAHVVLAALPIFYIGYLFNQKKYFIPFYIILIFLLIALAGFIFLKNNTYDMKYANYGIPFLTLFSSIIIILFIKNLASIISRFKIIANPLIKLGNASMVIMYLHVPIIILIEEHLNFNNYFIFISSTILSYLFYIIFSKFSITKFLLLGSKTDSEKIKFNY
ncbi:MAG: acyltransferase family protein [Flavobacteriales bacterium]|nr:acyltransferase family protein [Flavobacteriales bacterium]